MTLMTFFRRRNRILTYTDYSKRQHKEEMRQRQREREVGGQLTQRMERKKWIGKMCNWQSFLMFCSVASESTEHRLPNRHSASHCVTHSTLFIVVRNLFVESVRKVSASIFCCCCCLCGDCLFRSLKHNCLLSAQFLMVDQNYTIAATGILDASRWSNCQTVNVHRSHHTRIKNLFTYAIQWALSISSTFMLKLIFIMMMLKPTMSDAWGPRCLAGVSNEVIT